ncbi:MAG TPA: chaperonin GroEL [Thermoanaerobaculia bacterium]|jgi:chaperonin GroEL|nr:chaperonin GroEL [Thermoanaerobaculia bacterium]
MSYSKLLFRDDARTKVLAGATLLADAVRGTLGPKSKSVLIEKKFGAPLVCNDGVTIVKEIHLADHEENLGAQLLREAAVRTGDAVGDGTTTSTLLAHALYAEGLRNVVAGSSAVDIRRGMDRGVFAVVAELKKLARSVVSLKEKEHVATVSAHNDPEIGRLVAEAVEKVGQEGVVSVEEAKGTETTMEIVEGMQFDRGFLSAYFVTNPEKVEVVLEPARILLYDKRISNLDDLLPLLQELAREATPLLVIAEDVEGEALATLVINKLRGVLLAAAVKAPGFGDCRKEMLQDIALLTGAKTISEELGLKLSKTQLTDLGRAARVVIDKEKTTIIGGAGAKEAIAGRCIELRKQIDDATSDYDREKLRERLAKLSGGVALIKVGAHSEADAKSRREAFEDAINATKAAVAEGIVAGGGVALLRTAAPLAKLESESQGDEKIGLRILRTALEVPARQIAINSGKDGGVVVEKIRDAAAAVGFDAAANDFVDMFERGIVDPAKVVRVALQNAASVAGVLLLSEATLTEVEEEHEKREPALAGIE